MSKYQLFTSFFLYFFSLSLSLSTRVTALSTDAKTLGRVYLYLFDVHRHDIGSLFWNVSRPSWNYGISMHCGVGSQTAQYIQFIALHSDDDLSSVPITTKA